MTENTSFSFGEAVDAALADFVGEEVSEVESIEDTEAEAEEILEEDNSEVEEEVVAEDETEDEESEVEDDGEGSDLVALGEDDEVVIDGETVKVKDALLRQADYTKKTQALAEERKAFEEEREAVTEAASAMGSLDEAWEQDPAGVITTFLGNTEDVTDTVGEAISALAEAGEVDPNMFVVRTILHLATNDMLEDDLRQMLGFDDETVAKAKEQAKQDKRISKLEKQVRSSEVEVEAEEEDGVEAARASLVKQWETIVEGDSNLAELDEEAQLKVRSEVAKIAIERGGIPLDVAYELMQAKQAKLEADAAAKKAAVTSKKRATKSVSKPSNGSGSAPSSSRNPSDLDSIIADAYRELGG